MPLFFISTERVPFLLQRRPLQKREDSPPLLLVALHVTHGRKLRTTCRRRCSSEHALHGPNKPGQGLPRQAARLPGGPALRQLPCSSPQRSRPKSQPSDLFAPRSANMLQLYRPRAQHLPARLLEQPLQASGSPADSYLLLLALRGHGNMHTPKTTILTSMYFECSATDEPLAKSSIGPRKALSKEPGRPSRNLLELLALG